jgi:hypothetical protein
VGLGFLIAVTSLVACAGNGAGAEDAACQVCDTVCNSCDATCPTCDVWCPAPDHGGEPEVDVIEPGDQGPVAPTYWTAAATNAVDDQQFITYKGQRIFALGIHPSTSGAWDGLAGPGECVCEPDDGNPDTPLPGCTGKTNDGLYSVHQAHAEGANFVYNWGYVRDREYLNVDPGFLGVWHWSYGDLEDVYGPGSEPVPAVVCEHGETTLGGFRQSALDGLKADFEDFKARRGRWSRENAPRLPPYDELPWFGWHPTHHVKGGGDGSDDRFTDAEAEAFAKATNFMIADTYSYVCNRWDDIMAIIMGQHGPRGECYDDWLARDDPLHREYFSASWDVAHSLRRKANPDAVIWMWMQGHGFDDDIGGGACHNGESNLWAMGPFPSLRYLRKEMMSSIVAGSTGLIFFGYGYNRQPQAAKVRSLIRALAWDEVMGPALLSPRLDVAEDLTFAGEGGRAHLMLKWDEESRTAYVLGANPGAHTTPFEVTFPWSLAKVEILDWWTPSWLDQHDIEIADRTLRWVAPQDEGFILRVTPLHAPEM